VLRAEGLIESRHGIGTFVKEQRRLQRRSRGRYGTARGLKSLLSHNFRHDIVFVGRGPAPAHIAEVMGLDPGAEVVIRRRHLYDKDTNRPEETGASYLPVEIAGGTFLKRLRLGLPRWWLVWEVTWRLGEGRVAGLSCHCPGGAPWQPVS
jgi:DNA-binding GntR family transcriptional regulator